MVFISHILLVSQVFVNNHRVPQCTENHLGSILTITKVDRPGKKKVTNISRLVFPISHAWWTLERLIQRGGISRNTRISIFPVLHIHWSPFGMEIRHRKRARPTPTTIGILKCYNRYSFCGLLPISSSYIIGSEAFDPPWALTCRILAGKKPPEGGREGQ